MENTTQCCQVNLPITPATHFQFFFPSIDFPPSESQGQLVGPEIFDMFQFRYFDFQLEIGAIRMLVKNHPQYCLLRSLQLIKEVKDAPIQKRPNRRVYVLRISRYSGFLWVVSSNTGLFLCGLKLQVESITSQVHLVSKKKIGGIRNMLKLQPGFMSYNEGIQCPMQKL